MSDQPPPPARLLLWRLAVAGGGDWNKEIKPATEPSVRKPLVDAGLMVVENRKPEAGGRALLYLSLTDRGWAWLSGNLATKLETKASTTAILERLLDRLNTYLDARQLSLAELLGPSPDGGMSGPADLPGPDVNQGTSDPADLPRQIETAYYRLSDNQPNVRVRLADLRAALPGVPRHQLDDALLRMATQGRAALYALDDPLELRPEDREAVLRTPAGDERHIIYLGGPGS
jgi:hypothetical protein